MNKEDKHDDHDHGAYGVDHTTIIYLMDKKGKYFEDNRINLPSFYALENFHNKDMEGCEIYKIHKWLSKSTF